MRVPAIPPDCPELCPACRDRIIHLSKRRPHESSSLLGQYVHDRVDKNLCWLDIDGAAWRSPHNILRIIEAKRPGQDVSFSQKTVLPMLAKAINVLAADDSAPDVAAQSGVFVLELDPYVDQDAQMSCDQAVVRRVYPGRVDVKSNWINRSYECSAGVKLDQPQLQAFLGGHHVEVLP